MQSWRTGKTGTFVYKNKKKLRCGYTTGTCAAIAARAAAFWLVSGVKLTDAQIVTPAGVSVRAAVEEWQTGYSDGVPADGGQKKPERRYAECAVRKDAGDDYDVTDGLLIFARVEYITEEKRPKSGDSAGPQVWVDGGAGVGRVTKPGLDQPVGTAAINSVPRRMIREAVKEVLLEYDETRSVSVTVFVPAGEEAAKKTFNPVLGIEGGISILGTSGIVEPMSEEALTETIRAHLRVLRAEGRQWVLAAPGNMGAGFLRRDLENEIGLPENQAVSVCSSVVTCSNFIGITIDMAGELGFQGLLFAGHLGKLVKLGNGIMMTHSREGDGRMDTLLSCALTAGAGLKLLKQIQAANTTEEAVSILREAGILEKTMEELTARIDRYTKRRAPEGLRVGVFLFDSAGKRLGGTKEAEGILRAAVEEQWNREKEAFYESESPD